MTRINGRGDVDTPPTAPNASGVSMTNAHTLFENVDVKVETFVGETRLTVSQLNTLKAGGIVPLDASLNEMVELRVNGVTIAHGELVAVGDRFGVRIVKLAQ